MFNLAEWEAIPALLDAVHWYNPPSWTSTRLIFTWLTTSPCTVTYCPIRILKNDIFLKLLLTYQQEIKNMKGLGRVVYDRVRKRKNYFEIPTFLQIEWGISRAGNSKSNENKNVFVYVFIWCFEFSRSWFSSFNLKKGGNFKIIFPFPYPIIYNIIFCVFWAANKSKANISA